MAKVLLVDDQDYVRQLICEELPDERHEALAAGDVKSEQQWRQREANLRCLFGKLLNVQENKRRRMARELNDRVAERLFAIRYGVEKHLSATSGNSRLEGFTLDDVLSVTKEAINETRRISWNLLPSELEDLGLIPSINGLIRHFFDSYPNIAVLRHLHIRESQIPGRLKIVIYRILEETLNNVGRHSGANRTSISLICKNKKLEFCGKDDGGGFDVVKVFNSNNHFDKGLGLQYVKESTHMSEGIFSVQSEPGLGTCIHASWNLD